MGSNTPFLLSLYESRVWWEIRDSNLFFGKRYEKHVVTMVFSDG